MGPLADTRDSLAYNWHKDALWQEGLRPTKGLLVKAGTHVSTKRPPVSARGPLLSITGTLVSAGGPLVLAGRSFVSTKVSPASTRNQKDQKDNASQTSFCVGRRTSSVKSLLCRSRDLPCRSVSLKDPLVSARAEGHLCQLKDLLRWSHGLLRLPESFFCRSEDLLYWPENLLCRRGNFLCWPDDFCGLSNALRRDFFGSWVALAMVVWCGRSQGDHFLPLGSCCWPLWASQRSLRAAKGQD